MEDINFLNVNCDADFFCQNQVCQDGTSCTRYIENTALDGLKKSNKIMPIASNVIANYKLSAENAAQINRRRTTPASIAERIKEKIWPTGAQAHIGNEAKEGQILPMVITGIWSDNCVNGQVFLDGNDTFWVTSALQGNDPGNWNYFMCD